MHITARSYLTAGISLTTAAALALTPLAIPANERTVALPTVTSADVQLTVTPGDVVAFFDTVQGEIEAFNAAVAQLALIPSQTVVQGLESAIELNNEIYTTLIDATDNVTLRAILETLQVSADNGLQSLAFAVGDNGETVVYSHQQIADLLSGIVTGSLSNVIAAAVGVLNNPLTVGNYANLLSSGVVASAALVGTNTGEIIRSAAHVPLELTRTQLHLASSQINNALFAVGQLITDVVAATGSELIGAVATAVESITLIPAQLVLNAPFQLANNTIGAIDAGLNTLLNGIVGNIASEGPAALGLIGIASTVLQVAINEVGTNPLDPARYLEASGALIAGGFDSFNLSVATAGDLARVPLDLVYRVVNPEPGTGSLTYSVIRMNEMIGTALSGLLVELGLPEDISNLPRLVAAQLNTAIAGGADLVVDGLGFADDVIGGTTGFLIDVSNDIENALLGDVPPPADEPEVTALAVSEDSSKSQTDDDSADDIADEELQAEDEPAEDEPAEDEVADEESADEKTAEDAAADPAEDEPSEDADTTAQDASESDETPTEKTDSTSTSAPAE
ncbi:hypothetical protein MMUR_03370 [Mycolicibacterium murale]|uniref:PE-PGRS family protein n=1 Tax=Mycolicibacterium murale TaxID=182220 RepID=A0A7I9WEM7_9MYCO|nr:hypothetical protein [Mycolicibacterium murale]MCV7182371.1 hypothetical protein [Mycolicibacterium murale]GFG56201.1 hypothetical protein MMUR_03370 [Mycolicibacterium murale]